MNRGFINNAYVAHEIRGNLAVSCTALQLLKASALSDSQQNLLDKIERAQHSMLRISEALLDAHKIVLCPQEMNLYHFLVTLAEQAGDRIRAKGLDFICNFQISSECLILADALRLEQVITNLIDNAVKFTDRGQILFSADILEDRRSDALMQIAVGDTGRGIDAESIDKIFTCGVKKGRGNGIGLSVCHSIALALNGTLSVESTPGKGSVFRFTFPTEKAGESD